MLKYILDADHNAIPCDDLAAWGRQFGDQDARRVGRTVVGPYTVSTIFLGLDHAFGDSGPLLFETMVFKDDSMSEVDGSRCATWAEAETMHADFVERYRGRLS